MRWRNTVETLALRGCTPPMVAFDLDLANMLGSIEWPEIRAAVDRHFVEASAWVTWCHAEPEAALGDRLVEHRARMQHAHGASSAGFGSVDQWYVGQAFVRLDIADEWPAVGRLLCTTAYAASHPDWASYIRKTCLVGVGPSTAPKVLGVHIGGEDKLTLAVAQACAAVEGLQDPAVELTLQRCCLNNSKASHLLRCNGDRVGQAACSALTRAWRRDWPLHSVTTSRMTVGRRLFRLTQADLACEKQAPSLCRPSWQVGSPLAPMVAEMCQHTAVCALLRFLCRPTTPVPLQHGPCGCKGSRMLCMTKLVSSWLTPATWHSGAAHGALALQHAAAHAPCG